ncbi:MAG TPA: helix-turn-helix domain-containing protein [Hyphomonadaceae bacterium]|jgi:AcrR family transcriptional regulator|nr:helix-turn-helix domain-containing protein [Hyphomonadaceae bacterium]
MADDSDDKMSLGRRERTRARLIEAADKLIRKQGYEALVMEDVAERAGVTRRTIYDHFRDKDELIIAVIYGRPTQLIVAIKPGQTLRAYLRTIAATVIKMSQDNRELGQSTAYLHLYVLTHEDMRLNALARNRQIYAAMEATLIAAFGDDAFGMAPRKFIRVLHALIEGLLMRRHMMSEDFPNEVVYAAFDALADAAS